ncbi:hypothetical protein [Umezawaea beigongshangensis]|uniref:hypothetical protein n=1 Tax=Umezawaea beigongshangensis TaxID=2780383 RepID=UPI0018F16BEA|nr:hypothetical protein [Umezawaea beigongshangensis]
MTTSSPPTDTEIDDAVHELVDSVSITVARQYGTDVLLAMEAVRATLAELATMHGLGLDRQAVRTLHRLADRIEAGL